MHYIIIANIKSIIIMVRESVELPLACEKWARKVLPDMIAFSHIHAKCWFSQINTLMASRIDEIPFWRLVVCACHDKEISEDDGDFGMNNNGNVIRTCKDKAAIPDEFGKESEHCCIFRFFWLPADEESPHSRIRFVIL